MNNELYNYSPIVERPRLAWPNGARVAFYVGLNVEHFAVDKPSTSAYSARCRPLIPPHAGPRFRAMPAGDSAACRPLLEVIPSRG